MTREQLIAVLGDNKEAIAGLDKFVGDQVAVVKNANADALDVANTNATRYKTELETLQAKNKSNSENLQATNNSLEERVAEMEEKAKADAVKAQETQDRLTLSELDKNLIGDFVGVASLSKELVTSGRVKVGNDGSVSVTVDGKEASWDDAIKSLKAEKPDMVKVEQVGGFGDGGGESADFGEVDLVDQMMGLSRF